METAYNVILRKGVNYQEFWDYMETVTNMDGIPNREVSVANRREGSQRQTHYYLTEEEKAEVLTHPYVLDVELHPEDDPDSVFKICAEQSGSFGKSSNVGAATIPDNYGLLRCSMIENRYHASLSPPSESYYYVSDGTGVDVVIMDSGVDATHPDFIDFAGSTRVDDRGWTELSGTATTNGDNNYTDFDGHGTHVAGTVAGKIYGHAKGARIFSAKLSGLQQDLDTSGMSTFVIFDRIKEWHQSKPKNELGFAKRPTVVNMSWATVGTIASGGTRNVFYRGALTSSVTLQQARDAGVNNYSPGEFNIQRQSTSIATDVEEMTDAGIHVVIAAGNDNLKMTNDTSDHDYNNYINRDGGSTLYYNRRNTPWGEDAIIVGATENSVTGSGTTAKEKKATFSNKGDVVNIYAPGRFIMSTLSSGSIQYKGRSGALYYDAPNHYYGSLSGTSMASPQVAGVLACLLQVNPNLTPAKAKEILINDATNMLHDPLPGGGPYNSYNLEGSQAKFLYNRYAGRNISFDTEGGINFFSASLDI